ncbi:hypothetical protein YDYSY3_22580 [Paenibacillus chitinolyticus]|nr:hypothetical protein YDYSY3_22580 [Paenibacillus chitinolyticus]
MHKCDHLSRLALFGRVEIQHQIQAASGELCNGVKRYKWDCSGGLASSRK